MRVAVGLVLLSDPVEVDVLDQIDHTPAVDEQLEVMEFAEIPVKAIEIPGRLESLAKDIFESDVVYVL